MFKKNIIAIATTSALLFTACGGGGDSTPATTTPETPTNTSVDSTLLTASNFCNTASNIIVLENTITTNSNDATSIGRLYLNTNCNTATNETTNSGVQVKSLINDTKTKLVYSKISGVEFNTATPDIIYVKSSTTSLAQVVYQINYEGKNFFIESGSDIYSATFPSNPNDYNKESTALEITKVN